MSKARQTIPLDDALLLLPEGEYIHSFRNSPFALLGADWDRADLIAAMTAAPEIELTGPSAQSMDHGLAIKDEYGWLFIETKKW
jgi:hypothetical protein